MSYKDLEYKEQKSKVLKDLNQFVKHSEIVYRKTKIIYKSKQEIITEIERIKNFIFEVNKYSSLFDICLKIFRLKKRLYKILPHPNNSSYENQFNKLSDMIEFSTGYIKQKTSTSKNLITI